MESGFLSLGAGSEQTRSDGLRATQGMCEPARCMRSVGPFPRSPKRHGA